MQQCPNQDKAMETVPTTRRTKANDMYSTGQGNYGKGQGWTPLTV